MWRGDPLLQSRPEQAGAGLGVTAVTLGRSPRQGGRGRCRARMPAPLVASQGPRCERDPPARPSGQVVALGLAASRDARFAASRAKLTRDGRVAPRRRSGCLRSPWGASVLSTRGEKGLKTELCQSASIALRAAVRKCGRTSPACPRAWGHRSGEEAGRLAGGAADPMFRGRQPRFLPAFFPPKP